MFEELDSGHLREYARHLARQGWTAGTVRTYYAYVSAFCGWAEDRRSHREPKARKAWYDVELVSEAVTRGVKDEAADEPDAEVESAVPTREVAGEAEDVGYEESAKPEMAESANVIVRRPSRRSISRRVTWVRRIEEHIQDFQEAEFPSHS